MPLIIPLSATPSQIVNTILANQQCQLNVYQKLYGLFMDVNVGGTLIIGGVICENMNRIVRSAYLSFSGDFAFNDTQGTSDPVYSGLGTQYQLLYYTQAELEALGLAG